MLRKRNITIRKFTVFFVLLSLFSTDAVVSAAQMEPNEPNESQNFFQMSLEELMEVPIEITGALTRTTRRKIPSAITTLTKEDIRRSGARSLDELLDITIPNLQWVRHSWEFHHLGLRGTISDRDVKYLLLVNGRVMNERTHFGALSERDLPTLTDIHHIDVVRGPGSALYGPGAIAMVINIITENANTFQGTEVTGRLGAIEEFYSSEVKYGEKFGDGSGIFLYGGITDYLGADASDAPFVFGLANNYGSKGGVTYPTGHHADYNTWRDHQAFRDRTKLKFHGEYTNGGLDVWLRYTRGGEFHGPFSAGAIDYFAGTGYQQVTAYAGYKLEFNQNLNADFALSYDMFDHDTSMPSNQQVISWGALGHDNFREDEYYAKAILNWTPHQQHSVAFGGEYSHERFGKSSPGYPAGTPPVTWIFGRDVRMPRWSTDTYSILGEYQWQISDRWTTFIGGRLDDNTFTPRMYSPRAALIYTPTPEDTFKFLWNRSVRMSNAEDLKHKKITTGEDGDTEQIDALEIRFERQHTEHLYLAGSLFYHDLDLVGWDNTNWLTASLGNIKTFGFEVEAAYKTKRTKFSLSHGFAKLKEIHLEPGVTTFESSHQEGYGHDLANWSNHITKLAAQYNLTDQLSVDGSLRIYWGYPGAEEYAKWANDIQEAGWAPWNYRYMRGYTKPFGTSAFFNLGLEYKPADNLTIRVDGYNILGWFDIDLNKRLVRYDDWAPADYRSSAPAVGVSLQYRF
jgi:iron complex outermembrane receptor protein